jgi:hypothetical protein
MRSSVLVIPTIFVTGRSYLHPRKIACFQAQNKLANSKDEPYKTSMRVLAKNQMYDLHSSKGIDHME